jgi:hypothetical protein
MRASKLFLSHTAFLVSLCSCYQSWRADAVQRLQEDRGGAPLHRLLSEDVLQGMLH